MRRAMRRFFDAWMRKDTPYLMWLLSPFTAFRVEDEADPTPDQPVGTDQPPTLDGKADENPQSVARWR